MKIYISNELKSRLTHAAANGSIIATDILSEVKKNIGISDIIRGSYNYFSTKRKRTDCSTFQKIRVIFTACNKDLNNKSFPDKDNPQAPWFPENRANIEPSTFVGLFKNLREYNSQEIDYFCSCISLDSKISIKLYSGMNDFMEAYNESYYSPIADSTDSTLHHSCMRYEDKARNAADFYANFAGAKILVARDENSNVLGRAIVWENVKWQTEGLLTVKISLLDRIYVSHTFILSLMKEYARSAGIHFHKKYNDYEHTTDCVVMNPVEGSGIEAGSEIKARLSLEVPSCKWHKKGVPYLDTFCGIHLENGKLELRNFESTNKIAYCRNTQGCADKVKKVCPKCGKIHDSLNTSFCKDCNALFYTQTSFGNVLKGTPVDYKGQIYPSILFKKGRPLPEFSRYLQIEKLYIS